MTSLAMTRYHTLRAPAIALSDYRLSLDAVQAQGAAVEVVCRSYAHAQMRIRASDTALTELLAEDGERDTLRHAIQKNAACCPRIPRASFLLTPARSGGLQQTGGCA